MPELETHPLLKKGQYATLATNQKGHPHVRTGTDGSGHLAAN